MPGLFIIYKKVGPGVGRIVSNVTVLDSDAYAAQLTAIGEKFYYVPMDGFTGYFELDEADEVVAISSREPWAGSFRQSSVPILETAVLPDVPPTSIRVLGPSVESHVDHPGGDFCLKLGIPGQYTIGFEAFPYLPYETTLTITNAVSEGA